MPTLTITVLVVSVVIDEWENLHNKRGGLKGKNQKQTRIKIKEQTTKQNVIQIQPARYA